MSDAPGAHAHPDGCPSLEVLEAIAGDGPADADARRAAMACPQCRRAIDRIREDNELLGELISAHGADTERTTPLGPPTQDPTFPRIDGYALEREIHRGGQGVVYAAMQLATKRPVAVKTLLAGRYAGRRRLARFEREVELAATLRHPNIVTIYESGRTGEGDPYLAMEFVEGVTLDEYAPTLLPADGARRRGFARPVLGLFAQICDGLQFAHQRGVIHRDMKPRNIIVGGDATPRILDFGIAKAIGADTISDIETTREGEFVGTFRYAAPEQVAGDANAIDVRTDVYALGVILYELLTGERPYQLEGGIKRIVETIAKTEPRRPSSIVPAIDDELGAIVLKALEKDTARRYQSVRQLREDIDAYLGGRAILAKSHTRSYVLRKTLRRHRVPIAIAAGFFLLINAAAIVSLVLLYRADAQLRKKDRLQTAWIEALTSLDQETSNVRVSTLDEFLLRISQVTRRELGAEPELLASLEMALGAASIGRRDLRAAEEHFRNAIALEERRGNTASPALAALHHEMGRTQWQLADYEASARHYQTALDMRSALFGGEHAGVAETAQHLGFVKSDLQEFGDAERLLRLSIDTYRALPTDHREDIANSWNGVARCMREQERHEQAERHYRTALGMIADIAGKGHWKTAAAHHTLGTCLLDQRRFEEAERHLHAALEIKRALSPSPINASRESATLYRLAALCYRRAEAGPGSADSALLAQAESYLGEAIGALDALPSPPRERLFGIYTLRAAVALRNGRPDDAGSWSETALQHEGSLSELEAAKYDNRAASALLESVRAGLAEGSGRGVGEPRSQHDRAGASAQR